MPEKQKTAKGQKPVKPKVMLYWCASCGGCDEAVLDLNEEMLKLVEAVDIVLWPVALDFKYRDVRALAEGEVAATLINGAVRTSEQEEMVRLLREKSGLVVAFGACACMGGIPGLANLTSRAAIFARAYQEAPTVVNPEGILPRTASDLAGLKLHLPEFHESVRALDQVIEVDYYLPGCPPPPDLIQNAMTAILQGNLPPRGSVLAPDKTLCDTCPRSASRPDRISLSQIRRVHEVMVEPDRCFLEAGIICLGMGTRSGCGERCLKANMPCNGCFGPTSRTTDQGAKLLSAVASLFDARSEEEARRLAGAVVDPAGTFYRYGLPRSLWQGKA